MGKKWIYRLKKEDFAHVAQRLNVALEGRLDDMRKALSEYYSETENDPHLFFTCARGHVLRDSQCDSQVKLLF